jgi:hypothetical protein
LELERAPGEAKDDLEFLPAPKNLSGPMGPTPFEKRTIAS